VTAVNTQQRSASNYVTHATCNAASNQTQHCDYIKATSISHVLHVMMSIFSTDDADDSTKFTNQGPLFDKVVGLGPWPLLPFPSLSISTLLWVQ